MCGNNFDGGRHNFFSGRSTSPKRDQNIMSSPQCARARIPLRFNLINDVYEARPLTTLPALLKQLATPTSAFVVAGDFLGGSQLSVALSAAHVVPLLNELGADLVCLGNHEFDFGPKRLEALIAQSRFPWLCANAVQSANGARSGRESLPYRSSL